MKSFLNKSILSLTTIAVVLSVPELSAQSSLIEEVVVTAQKREESAQDVPISISAITGDNLHKLGVENTGDLIKVIPNLSLKETSSINQGFSIRGVGTSNFHVTAQQAVGQYLDEVSLISPFTGMFALFDMERVEVLKGPQNTLFGRNTTGGAVNMISRKPEIGGGFSGFGRINGGNEGRIDFEGGVNIPIGDTAAARIAVQTLNRDGIFNNLVNGEKIGSIERHSGRVQLAWEPTDATRVLVNAHAGFNRGKRRSYRGNGFWEAGGPTNVLASDGSIMDVVAVHVNPALSVVAPIKTCGSLTDGTSQYEGVQNCISYSPATNSFFNPSTGDWHDVVDGAPNRSDVDSKGGFIKFEHDFENFTLTSISAYDVINVQLADNISASAFAGFFPGQDAEYKTFQQEFRIVSTHDGPWRWILGGYYSREDDTLATIIRNGAADTPPFTVVPSVEIVQDVDIWSAYGKIDIDITDRLTLNGGLRITNDFKKGISITRVIAGTSNGRPGPRLPDDAYFNLSALRTAGALAGGICPPQIGGLPCESAPLPVKQNITEMGGRIGATLNFTDDVMGYVHYSRGFKSGAFDTRALAAFAGNADRPAGPEFLNAVEAGMKSTLLDGAMEFNASVFRYNWKDLQVFTLDETGATAFLNVPKTKLYGIDADIKWSPAAEWYTQAGFGYTHSEVKDSGGFINVREGASLDRTPEFSFSGLVRRQFSIGNGLLALQTNFQWTDKSFSGLTDSPVAVTDATFFINARATYYFGSEEQYELSVWGENLTSEKSCSNQLDNGPLNFLNQCLPNDGMAFFGGSFQYNF